MRYLTVVKKKEGSKVIRRRGGRKPYRKKTARYGTTRVHRAKLMGTKHNSRRHHLVRKAFLGIQPTAAETGASAMTEFIVNSLLKGTPNGEGGFNYTFTLANFPNYTDLTNIYQFYRIKSVTITFYPEQNSYPAGRTDAQNVTSNASSGQKSHAPCLIYAVDRTSTVIFTNENAALAHEGSKLHVFNGPEELSVTFRPTILTTAGPSGSTVTVPGKLTWIPTASTGLVHYGLKCYIARMSDYNSIRVVMSMTAEFKDTKI